MPRNSYAFWFSRRVRLFRRFRRFRRFAFFVLLLFSVFFLRVLAPFLRAFCGNLRAFPVSRRLRYFAGVCVQNRVNAEND